MKEGHGVEVIVEREAGARAPQGRYTGTRDPEQRGEAKARKDL